MPVQIASVAVPTTIATRAVIYDWQPPPIIKLNGRGRVVSAGYASLLWTWDLLEASDWTYWVTTVLSGANDRLVNTGTTQLYDRDQVLKTVTSCVIYRPSCQTIKNNVYVNVELRIGQIVTA